LPRETLSDFHKKTLHTSVLGMAKVHVPSTNRWAEPLFCARGNFTTSKWEYS